MRYLSSYGPRSLSERRKTVGLSTSGDYAGLGGIYCSGLYAMRQDVVCTAETLVCRDVNAVTARLRADFQPKFSLLVKERRIVTSLLHLHVSRRSTDDYVVRELLCIGHCHSAGPAICSNELGVAAWVNSSAHSLTCRLELQEITSWSANLLADSKHKQLYMSNYLHNLPNSW